MRAGDFRAVLNQDVNRRDPREYGRWDEAQNSGDDRTSDPRPAFPRVTRLCLGPCRSFMTRLHVCRVLVPAVTPSVKVCKEWPPTGSTVKVCKD
jgi:hypothetical protein